MDMDMERTFSSLTYLSKRSYWLFTELYFPFPQNLMCITWYNTKKQSSIHVHFTRVLVQESIYLHMISLTAACRNRSISPNSLFFTGRAANSCGAIIIALVSLFILCHRSKNQQKKSQFSILYQANHVELKFLSLHPSCAQIVLKNHNLYPQGSIVSLT